MFQGDGNNLMQDGSEIKGSAAMDPLCKKDPEVASPSGIKFGWIKGVLVIYLFFASIIYKLIECHARFNISSVGEPAVSLYVLSSYLRGILIIKEKQKMYL